MFGIITCSSALYRDWRNRRYVSHENLDINESKVSTLGNYTKKTLSRQSLSLYALSEWQMFIMKSIVGAIQLLIVNDFDVKNNLRILKPK